jgi:hypothetical protein
MRLRLSDQPPAQVLQGHCIKLTVVRQRPFNRPECKTKRPQRKAAKPGAQLAAGVDAERSLQGAILERASR